MPESDIDEVIVADEVLDALASPTSSEVWRAMHGHGAEVVAAVAARRAMEGGSGLPPEWTIGAGGQLAILSTTDATTLDVEASPGQTADVVQVYGNALGSVFVVDEAGAVTIDPETDAAIPLTIVPNAGQTGDLFRIDAKAGVVRTVAVSKDGRVTLKPDADTETLILDNQAAAESYLLAAQSNGSVMGGILAGGFIFIAVHAAPADAALQNGECALWFDQTNGASKFMVKGKSADGTVVQGEVALA